MSGSVPAVEEPDASPDIFRSRLQGRQLLQRWAQRALATGAAMAQRFGRLREPSVTGILMYHRVVPNPRGVAPPTWNVPPQQFRRQLTGLLERGYQPLRLNDLIAAHRAGHRPQGRFFVVTFDDACSNVSRYALPILSELHIPATVFLATAYLDSPRPFPFDDWHPAAMPDTPAETWRPLSTAECLRMQASGWIDLGSHTHTHGDFRGRPEQFRADLLRSLMVLSHQFGLCPHEIPFAFPYGTVSLGFACGALSRIAQETGVSCALSTRHATLSPGEGPFDWGRFTAWDFDSGASLAGKLDGWYSAIRHVVRRDEPAAPVNSISA